MFLPAMAHGALLPTLSARPNPQVWYTGSAVDQDIHEDGHVFGRIRERGIKGEDPALLYLEWSAEAEDPESLSDALAGDAAVWAQANPGLGIRISHEHIERERRSMDPRTFAVERLGVGDWPQEGANSGIDFDSWDTLTDIDSQPPGRSSSSSTFVLTAPQRPSPSPAAVLTDWYTLRSSTIALAPTGSSRGLSNLTRGTVRRSSVATARVPQLR
jgi:hypothetical protein